ncbi:MAG: tRNA pseudouridine(55) synthase TruB [Bdellovibrionales bacterium]|nr:tRNA pseudouridine(55) synthase TruB [Bdellovibrionales bacterium]
MDGLLIIDKPVNLTSHDVVHRCRKILKRKDIGHTGTLDPFASGLMILLVGEATKVSNYVTNKDKTYQALLHFGFETNTLDRTGEKTNSSSCGPLSHEDLLYYIKQCEGILELEIPLYSAKKIKGKKLYEIAHEGKTIDLPTKEMTFFDIQLIEYNWPYCRVELSCSKGSFIRSWAQHLGRVSGAFAHLQELRRVSTGEFSLSDSQSLEKLDEIHSKNKDLSGVLREVSSVVDADQTVTVKGAESRLLRNGQIPFNLRKRLISQERLAQKLSCSRSIKVVDYNSRHILAMLEAHPSKPLKIKRIFNFVRDIKS